MLGGSIYLSPETLPLPWLRKRYYHKAGEREKIANGIDNSG
jgi:hypothetical protein